jgi:hypothetical protein
LQGGVEDRTDHFPFVVVDIVAQIDFSMLTVADARLPNVVIEHRFAIIGVPCSSELSSGANAVDWIERRRRLDMICSVSHGRGETCMRDLRSKNR